jgi:hypothetical protein
MLVWWWGWRNRYGGLPLVGIVDKIYLMWYLRAALLTRLPLANELLIQPHLRWMTTRGLRGSIIRHVGLGTAV